MFNDTYPLFRNTGKAPAFEDFTTQARLGFVTRRLTGWGVWLYDFDNDGFKDVFTANSHFPGLDPYLGSLSALPNSVFHHSGSGWLEDDSKSAGNAFQSPGLNRGVAFADFDNDGRVDAVVSNINGPARLYRNVTRNTGHWLALKLTGTRSNRDAIGAKVAITLSSGRKLYNHCTTSVGYASSSEPLVRFGLGGERSVKLVEIRWTNGRTQQLRDVQVDRVLNVREP